MFLGSVAQQHAKSFQHQVGRRGYVVILEWNRDQVSDIIDEQRVYQLVAKVLTQLRVREGIRSCSI